MFVVDLGCHQIELRGSLAQLHDGLSPDLGLLKRLDMRHIDQDDDSLAHLVIYYRLVVLHTLANVTFARVPV